MVVAGTKWNPPNEEIKGKPTEEYQWKVGLVYVIPAGVLLVCGVWLVISGAEAVKVFINPEFYAIRDLLKMLMRPGL